MEAYLDTNIVIYLVEENEPQASAIRQALTGNTTPATSELVRLEARVGPLRSSNTQLLSKYDRFFAGARFLLLTRAVFDRAAEIRASSGLKTPDALHLATALEHGCDELWTNDRRFHAVAGGLAVRIL